MSQQQTNPFYIRQLAEYVQSRIGRQLRLDELSWLRNFAKEHVPQQMHLTNIQLAQSIRHLGNHVARLVATHSQQREVIDVHEMLHDIIKTDGEGPLDNGYVEEEGLTAAPKQVVEAERVLGTETPREFSLFLQSPAGYGCTHLLLNSSLVINPNNLTQHLWDVYNVGSSGFGRVAFSGTLWSIVSARVGAFTIPEPVVLQPVQVFLDEFYISIKEFNPQGFYTKRSNIVHFPLVRGDNNAVIDGRRGLNALSQNKGLFEFDKPLTLLNQITLTFYVQDIPLEIPPSCFLDVVVVFNAGFTTTTLVIPQLTDPKFSPYTPVPGDGVVMGDALSNTVTASQVGTLGSRTGWSVLNFFPPNEFLLDVPWQNSWISGSINFERVCLPKNTWRIPLTLIYKRPFDEFDPR